jgi:hypothetical protein
MKESEKTKVLEKIEPITTNRKPLTQRMQILAPHCFSLQSKEPCKTSGFARPRKTLLCMEPGKRNSLPWQTVVRYTHKFFANFFIAAMLA